MPIRTRLTFLYASLLGVALLMFGAATLSVLNWTLRRQVDDTLLEAAEDVRVAAIYGADPTSSGEPVLGELFMAQINRLNAPGLFAQIWLYDPQTNLAYAYGSSWSLLSMSYNGALDAKALGSEGITRRDVFIEGDHLRVVTVPLMVNNQLRGYIQTGSSLRTIDAALDRLLKIMLGGGAITLSAALLFGEYLTRRALRPIDTIAQTARQITAADDLSLRIPYKSEDELGELTETFNQTLERLERLFNAQRRFVADVSHEMRTPLTAIRGNVSLMARIGYDDESMTAIDGEARRMTRLVEDLLLLAKADAGRMPLETALVELDTLVLETYNQARLLSDSVTVRLGQIDQVQVMGDSDRLKQLLLNLVTNGLKYTPAGGEVSLSIRRDEGWVMVDVCDTGVGIPTEDLPNIFDRFYRVDKARSRAMGGTGLGLSIAKWIAEAHGGDLTVQSVVDEGSTFTLKLPLVPDDVPHDALRKTIPHARAIRNLSSRGR
ncbi:MAG: HAMP domain-containing histidine kinase [Anaerolineae bacterium]|nr:HAMP domain-containing histidine kinase [Anaerolineae bacterium]